MNIDKMAHDLCSVGHGLEAFGFGLMSNPSLLEDKQYLESLDQLIEAVEEIKTRLPIQEGRKMRTP